MDLILKFTAIGLIIQRLIELYLSNKNIKKSIKQNAILIKENNYLFMVMIHISWLIGLIYFAFFKKLELNNFYFYTGLSLFLLGQALRITAILTLRDRWSTRILIRPNQRAVKKGIFNFIRHPNYLGVVIELFSLPFAIQEFQFLIFFSILNFITLYFRIGLEEKMLIKYNQYNTIFKLRENN